MATKRALEVVREFVAAVNEHDLDRTLGLMTEDHVFVDSGGATVHGREPMGRVWRRYFAMFADSGPIRLVVGKVSNSG